jgi:uncharacterized protein (DUF2236 family)
MHLPTEAEARDLIPKPGGPTWRYAGDARLMAASGYALTLQVAHPTVAAGVREHSNYAQDPWGRLLRTLDYLYVMSYGGPEQAVATGRRLREMHKQIRGVAPDGTRYSALEPEAFAWVHATLVDAVVVAAERFGPRMTPGEVQELYREFLDMGKLIGVREGDLPRTWGEFRGYYDAMVRDTLEHNDVIDGVFETLSKPLAPDVPLLGDRAWRVVRLPIARTFQLATAGLLPPLLRERCGMRWTRANELELRALGRVSRAAGPLMPKRLRNVGPAYLEWRREALQRRPAASGLPAAPAARAA